MAMLPWRCILFSEVKTEGRKSLYYFRNLKPKGLGMHSIFDPEKLKALEAGWPLKQERLLALLRPR